MRTAIFLFLIVITLSGWSAVALAQAGAGTDPQNPASNREIVQLDQMLIPIGVLLGAVSVAFTTGWVFGGKFTEMKMDNRLVREENHRILQAMEELKLRFEHKDD